MAKKKGLVYCYRLGSDRFRIGRTKDSPKRRMKNWSAGSPDRPDEYRVIDTDDAPLLEGYLHNLLQESRAENGDIFNVTANRLDAVIDQALHFMQQYQPLAFELDARELRQTKPVDALAKSTREIGSIHRQLLEARSKRFLLQKQIDVLEMRIKLAIGENAGIDGVASWNWISRWSVDLRRFEKENPEAHEKLFEEYKYDFGARKFVPLKGAVDLLD